MDLSTAIVYHAVSEMDLEQARDVARAYIQLYSSMKELYLKREKVSLGLDNPPEPEL